MSTLPAIFQQIVDAVGEPISGGLLFSYEADTTDLKTTYSDRERTVANANPVVADADGVFGDVYLTPNEAYKFVHKTPAGVTLRTTDNRYSSQTTDSEGGSSARLKQLASNPIDFPDAVILGDGVADEVLAVQWAIDNVSGNGVVDLLGLTFACGSQITIPSGVTLRNGQLDFTLCEATSFILIAGSLVGSGVTVNPDPAFADRSVDLDSVSGIMSGDLLNIYSSDNYTQATAGTRGEITEIQSISSPTVSLHSPIHDIYDTSPLSKEVTTVDDVLLEELRINGDEGVGDTRDLIAAVNCRRLRIRNCDFSNADDRALTLDGCYGVLVSECTFRDGINAIRVGGASKFVRIVDCPVISGFKQVLYVSPDVAVSGGATGVPRYITMDNCGISTGEGTATALFAIEGASQFTKVTNCNINQNNNTSGPVFQSQSADVEISDNVIFRDGSGAADAVIVLDIEVPLRSLNAHSVIVRNNKIQADVPGILASGMVVSGGAGALQALEISGNQIESSDTASITVYPGSDGGAADTPTITDLIIRGNKCNVVGADGVILVDSQHADGAVTRLHLIENDADVITIGGTSSNISKVISHDNRLTGIYTVGTSGAIEVGEFKSTDDTCFRLVVNEVEYIDIGKLDVRTTAGNIGLVVSNDSKEFARLTIANSYFFTGDSSTHLMSIVCTSATDSENFVFSDNICIAGSLTSSARVLRIGGELSRFAITGNLFKRGDDGGSLVQLVGDGAGDIKRGIISGNVFVDGSYGVLATNISSVVEKSNLFISQSIDETTGLTFESRTIGISFDIMRKYGDRASLLPNAGVIGGPVGTLGLVDNNPENVAVTLQTDDMKAEGNSPSINAAIFQWVVPDNFILGSTVSIRIFCGMLTTIADGDAFINVEAYVPSNDGTANVSSDLVTPAAQNCNNLTSANFTFVIDDDLTNHALGAGSVVNIVISINVNDNATGTVVKGIIRKIDILINA